MITIPIRSSRILLGIIVCSHSLAVVALTLADIFWMLRIFLAVAVVLHALYSYQKYYAMQHPDSVVEIVRNGDSWSLRLARGSCIAATLGPVLITSFLTLINFQSTPGGRKFAVLLFPDTTDQQLIRQLRSWLRYEFKRSESHSE